MSDGFKHHKFWFDETLQAVLLRDVKKVLSKAPLYIPVMPKSGKPFSVQESNCGPLGWVSDKAGYRYQPEHPVTGKPWPPIPEVLMKMWQSLADYEYPPEACLINYYQKSARMGLHQDRDEEDFTAPIVSVSLGSAAVFRIGGKQRRGKTKSITLNAGDVIVMGGDSRMYYHGIDRIIDEPGNLGKIGGGESAGRINLTLRRVTKPSGR